MGRGGEGKVGVVRGGGRWVWWGRGVGVGGGRWLEVRGVGAGVWTVRVGFGDDTATAEIYTYGIVGSVRGV